MDIFTQYKENVDYIGLFSIEWENYIEEKDRLIRASVGTWGGRAPYSPLTSNIFFLNNWQL